MLMAIKKEVATPKEKTAPPPPTLRLPINLSNPTPLMVVVLIIAAFLIGSLWTKVQVLEKGGVSVSGTTTQPGQAAAPVASVRPAPASLSAEKFNDVVKDAVLVSGNANAKVKLVEFTDFECPFCARFFTDTFPQIEKEYIQTGKIAYYIRHFPLYSLHPNAENASLAAECAKEQGKFKGMHDLVFQNQKALAADNLKSYAQQLGLNTGNFNSCLDSKKYKSAIDRDVKVGGEVGVTGTPAFFLNGRIIQGAQPFANFKATIDEELKK